MVKKDATGVFFYFQAAENSTGMRNKPLRVRIKGIVTAGTQRVVIFAEKTKKVSTDLTRADYSLLTTHYCEASLIIC